jgi:hypothetical protein
VVFLPGSIDEDTGLPRGKEKVDPELGKRIDGVIWLGRLKVQSDGDEALRILFRLTVNRDGTLSGILDNPDQGVLAVALEDLSLQEGKLHFKWKAINASYEGILDSDAAEIAGRWIQNGRGTPLNFKPLAPNAKPKLD